VCTWQGLQCEIDYLTGQRMYIVWRRAAHAYVWQQWHAFWQPDVLTITCIMAQYAKTLTALCVWQVSLFANILELICVMHIEREFYTASIMTLRCVDSQPSA
jgi:hypothetical protein